MSAYVPKVVLITGATGDFGHAFAKRFAALGSKLIVHGRNADKVKALVEDLDSDVYGTVFDMADTAGIDAGVAKDSVANMAAARTWSPGDFEIAIFDRLANGLRLIGELDGPLDWKSLLDDRFLPADLQGIK